MTIKVSWFLLTLCLLVVPLHSGCGIIHLADDDDDSIPVDADGDGWDELVDCDDSDAELNLDDVDNDGSTSCDGDCNDTEPAANLNDADIDSFTTCDGDCDDNDPTVYPTAAEVCDGLDNDCNGQVDEGDLLGGSAACAGNNCLDILQNVPSSSDGVYWIDPDNSGTSLQARCDMSGGGWTLCASLTKGYVPADTLHNFQSYAFQDRLNRDRNFAYETDAPARYDTTWDNSESLNYGQFCRLMDAEVSETSLQAKMYNYRNNGSSMRAKNYDATYIAVFSGNLFLNWFTNSSSSRNFNQTSGDNITVDSEANNYGGPYTTPSVRWADQQGGEEPNLSPPAPYTHSSTPWGNPCSPGSSCCVGCTDPGVVGEPKILAGFPILPYGQTTILNDTGHSFWEGIENLPYGWSDCTNNGDCDYHESGYGVWLFWVR